jgi:hypothetical protein
MESLDELMAGAESQRALELMELMSENAAAALDAAVESASTTPVSTARSTPLEPVAEDPWEDDPVGEMVGAVGDAMAGALEAVASPMTMVLGSCLLTADESEAAVLAVDDKGIPVDTNDAVSHRSSAVPTPRTPVPYYRAPRPGSNLTDSPHLFLANTGPAVGVPTATVRRRSRQTCIYHPTPPSRPPASAAAHVAA